MPIISRFAYGSESFSSAYIVPCLGVCHICLFRRVPNNQKSVSTLFMMPKVYILIVLLFILIIE